VTPPVAFSGACQCPFWVDSGGSIEVPRTTGIGATLPSTRVPLKDRTHHPTATFVDGGLLRLSCHPWHAARLIGAAAFRNAAYAPLDARDSGSPNAEIPSS
jgi:hypothetical protein